MTAESVRRIDIGGDSPEGTNSAYLVDDRAVVDPGPPTDRAWRDLREGLERADVSLRDLEAVLVTHWHADHAGLAPRLGTAADATLAMGAGDAPLVADYAAERARRLERDAETMRRWGVPDRAVERVISGDTVSAMPDEITVGRLRDGQTIAGLEVVATPGHTLGHTAFAGEGFLLVGDAVLPTTTPNVGGSDTRTIRSGGSRAQSAPDGDGAILDRNPLAAFRGALERLDDRSSGCCRATALSSHPVASNRFLPITTSGPDGYSKHSSVTNRRRRGNSPVTCSATSRAFTSSSVLAKPRPTSGRSSERGG